MCFTETTLKVRSRARMSFDCRLFRLAPQAARGARRRTARRRARRVDAAPIIGAEDTASISGARAILRREAGAVRPAGDGAAAVARRTRLRGVAVPAAVHVRVVGAEGAIVVVALAGQALAAVGEAGAAGTLGEAPVLVADGLLHVAHGVAALI